MSKLNVLLTGMTGRIGPHLLPAFREQYHLRTLDLNPVPDDPNHTVSDLSNIDTLREVMTGIDVLVHLAATSDEAPFMEQLLPNNIVGVYNIFEAAHQAKVRRIVFASTVQTVRAWGDHLPVRAADPPRPGTIYGVTKVFGETLGRWYHDKRGLEFVALRIGAFQPYDSEGLRKHQGMRDLWLSPRDAVQLLSKAIDTPDIGYAIVFGTSATEQERISLQEARDLLGYEPQDRSADIEKVAKEQ